VLEDPAVRPRVVHQRTIAPSAPTTKATVITVGFERATPSIDGVAMSPATLLMTKLNELGHDNGIGRLDLVENRYVGMKSPQRRPAGQSLIAAHRGIESITLDGAPLKDQLMPKIRRADLQRLLVFARA
jgi:argininosuccinate synthase